MSLGFGRIFAICRIQCNIEYVLIKNTHLNTNKCLVWVKARLGVAEKRQRSLLLFYYCCRRFSVVFWFWTCAKEYLDMSCKCKKGFLRVCLPIHFSLMSRKRKHIGMHVLKCMKIPARLFGAEQLKKTFSTFVIVTCLASSVLHICTLSRAFLPPRLCINHLERETQIM